MDQQDRGFMFKQDQGLNMNSVEALNGRAQAFEIAILQMMRVISQGLTGEDAYQHLARGLRADAENLKMMPGDMGKAGHYQLTMLASVCEQPPRG